MNRLTIWIYGKESIDREAERIMRNLGWITWKPVHKWLITSWATGECVYRAIYNNLSYQLPVGWLQEKLKDILGWKYVRDGQLIFDVGGGGRQFSLNCACDFFWWAIVCAQKNRTWITENTYSIVLVPWFTCTLLYSAAFAVQGFVLVTVQFPPPPLNKKKMIRP